MARRNLIQEVVKKNTLWKKDNGKEEKLNKEVKI